MKGVIKLQDTIFAEDEYMIKVNSSIHGFDLSIYIDEDNSLEKQLNNKEELDKFIDFMQIYFSIVGEDDEIENETINFVSENYNNIFDITDYIILDFELLDIKEYIEKNPFLLNKKIVLPGIYDINNYTELKEVYEKYKDIIDKIYINFQCNVDYTKLSDAIKTVEKIEEMVRNIKGLNLSPMETIMYVYDIVRDRVYQLENNDESYFASRDLSDVLFGDKIVCVGYANIFFTLLKYLGIESYEVTLKKIDEENIGHKRNIIYVNDEKYNIDGVYYFDATWDSKKDIDDKSYLYSYKNFAKTRKYIEECENGKYEDMYFDVQIDALYHRVKEIIENEEYSVLMQYMDPINYVSNLVKGESLLKFQQILPPNRANFDKKQFLDELKEILTKFDKEIPGERMLELLLNVRKLQYYQNPEKYPYSFNDIYYTFKKSGWNFTKPIYDANDIYNLIFNNNVTHTLLDDYIRYINKNDKLREIKGVCLSKVLSKHLDNRKR